MMLYYLLHYHCHAAAILPHCPIACPVTLLPANQLPCYSALLQPVMLSCYPSPCCSFSPGLRRNPFTSVIRNLATSRYPSLRPPRRCPVVPLSRCCPVAVCCRFGAVWCCMLPYGAVWCRMVPYVAVWCRMVPYVAVVATCCRCPVVAQLPYVAVWCRMLPLLPHVAVCCRMLPYCLATQLHHAARSTCHDRSSPDEPSQRLHKGAEAASSRDTRCGRPGRQISNGTQRTSIDVFLIEDVRYW